MCRDYDVVLCFPIAFCIAAIRIKMSSVMPLPLIFPCYYLHGNSVRGGEPFMLNKCSCSVFFYGVIFVLWMYHHPIPFHSTLHSIVECFIGDFFDIGRFFFLGNGFMTVQPSCAVLHVEIKMSFLCSPLCRNKPFMCVHSLLFNMMQGNRPLKRMYLFLCESV